MAWIQYFRKLQKGRVLKLTTTNEIHNMTLLFQNNNNLACFHEVLTLRNSTKIIKSFV